MHRLKEEFTENDWESLEKYVNDEQKLGILKNRLFDKLSNAKLRFDDERDWKMSSQLIGEMEECLYELQLVEHALKLPMLGIAKILFSINPLRYADRGASQIKQKPTKKRKNELGGLVGDLNDDLKKNPAREAKLLAVTQVHRHHQEEQFEEMIALGSDGPKRGRLKKRTVPTAASRLANNKDGTETATIVLQQAQNSNNLMEVDDEKQQNTGEEEESERWTTEMNNHNMLANAQIPTTFCEQSRTNSPQQAETNGNCSTEQIQSPLRTRATKKNSREADIGPGANESTRSNNSRSPRKRRASATEQHQNEGNEMGQMEIAEEENKERMGKQQQTDETAEPTYCLCEQVSFGEMICCDYELCSVEWFHFACVNIKSKPKGKKWFCPLCRYNDKVNMLKPELLHKLDLTRQRFGLSNNPETQTEL